HERQEPINQTRHHRERGVEDRQRLTDHVELEETGIYQARVAAQEDHGERPHQETGPERQHDEEEEEILPPPASGDGVRDGVAEQETDQGARNGHHERAYQDREIDGNEEPLVAFEREAARDAAILPARHRAVGKHDEQWDEKERDEEEYTGSEQPPGLRLGPAVEPPEDAFARGARQDSPAGVTTPPVSGSLPAATPPPPRPHAATAAASLAHPTCATPQ